MYWVIQEDLFHETGMTELVTLLERMGLPHSLHKVVPFSGDLIPDVNPSNPVVAIGAYSMIRISKRRGWEPGVWSNTNFDFSVWQSNWNGYCLNDDAIICPFALVPEIEDEFFMRPTMDSKAFAGEITDYAAYAEWRKRVVELKEDVGSTLTGETLVLVCSLKEILREYRLWVVDKKVVTSSLYRIGGRVRYDGNVDPDVIAFGTKMAELWSPDRAYVLDVALTPEGFKIIEINSLNSSGLYACNVGLLVEAIEGMGYLNNHD